MNITLDVCEACVALDVALVVLRKCESLWMVAKLVSWRDGVSPVHVGWISRRCVPEWLAVSEFRRLFNLTCIFGISAFLLLPGTLAVLYVALVVLRKCESLWMVAKLVSWRDGVSPVHAG